MDLIKIPFLIIGIIFGAAWTALLFTGAAIVSLSAILKAMNQAVTRLYVQEDTDGGKDSEAA